MIFDILPIEIVLKILEFLPDKDIICVYYVCTRLQNIILRYPIRSTLNLEKAHLIEKAQLKAFFKKDALSSKVKKLSVNGLWWLNPIKNSEINILKCPNLSELQLFDIQLTIDQLKTILLSCPKIEDIGFSWPKHLSKETMAELNCCRSVLNNIKNLSIYCVGKQHILEFLELTPNLEHFELKYDKLQDFHEFPRYEQSYINTFVGKYKFSKLMEIKLKSLFNQNCTRNRLLFILPVSSDNATTYLCDILHRFYFEIVIPEYVEWFCDCKKIEILMSHNVASLLHRFDKFPNMEELILLGINEVATLDLMLKMPRLESFHNFSESFSFPLDLYKLKELYPHLKKFGLRCFKKCHKEEGYILGQIECFTKLVHLCVPPCILQEPLSEEIQSDCQQNRNSREFLFKKPRLSRLKSKKDISKAAFNNIIEKCPHLRVLEIAHFNDGYTEISTSNYCKEAPSFWHSLENVQKLFHLTHLTLEFIPVTSGAFLIPIAEYCEKLEVLRLKDLGTRSMCVFMKELVQALPLFRNLLSFRLENNFLLPGTLLFKSLNKCPKLENVAILSHRESAKLHMESFLEFVLNKTSLIYVYMKISGLPQTTRDNIMRKVRSRRPRLSLHIEDADCAVYIKMGNDILSSHFREMVLFLPWISTK